MSRKANLTKCRLCGRLWNPPAGATPLHFCRACSKERRTLASEKHVQSFQRRQARKQAASDGWQAITVVEPLPAPQWPAPRTINQQMPPEGPMLIWVDALNEWRSGCMCLAADDKDFPIPWAQRLYYTFDGDRTERGYDLTPELIWMPLPPAPEDRANA